MGVLSSIVTKRLPTQTATIKISDGGSPVVSVGAIGQIKLQPTKDQSGRTTPNDESCSLPGGEQVRARQPGATRKEISYLTITYPLYVYPRRVTNPLCLSRQKPSQTRQCRNRDFGELRVDMFGVGSRFTRRVAGEIRARSIHGLPIWSGFLTGTSRGGRGTSASFSGI
jgi:hypothetical protein